MKAKTVVYVGIFLTICLIALTTISSVAAPAPDADRRARKTLETLKEKLPQTVAQGAEGAEALIKVKLARRIATDEAKIVLMVEGHDDKGKRLPDNDAYLVIYLRYFDGVWTTTRFEGNWFTNNPYDKRAALAMMLAIDQIGEK